MTRTKRATVEVARIFAFLYLIAVSRATDPTSPSNVSIAEPSKTEEKPIESKDVSTEKPSVAIIGGKSVQGWRGSKTNGDSYIDALRHSRYSPDIKTVRMDANPITVSANRREYVPGPVYVPQTAYGTVSVYGDQPEKYPKSNQDYSPPDHSRDSFSMTPSHSYSLPTKTSVEFQNRPNSLRSSYDSPRIVYGPPHKQQNPYGDYGGNSYLPPQPAYGSPSVSHGHNVPYGLPEVHVSEIPSIDFAWPFALKLNAFTLAKIILKLVIFKMIVKFIAVICLLLFIPKLKLIKKGNKGEMMDDDDDDDDEGRRFLPDNFISTERLNALTTMVLSSYEDYENRSKGRSNETCTDLSCHLRGSLSVSNSWSDYGRLFKSYLNEQRNTTES